MRRRREGEGGMRRGRKEEGERKWRGEEEGGEEGERRSGEVEVM